MSIEALTWAFKQRVKPSGAKFVLVALANMANERCEAYPSIAYLSDVTQQDRKSVIEHLDQLQAIGLIADSGKRKGSTGQVKVYQVNSTETGTVEASQKRYSSSERVPFLDSKSTVFPSKSTENGTRIPHEPTLNTHEVSLGENKTKTERETYSEALRRYGAFDERTKAAKKRLQGAMQ